MSRASKGSAFERSFCKELSLWLTDGAKDDVFWRSSQSGGRATERAKKGLKTAGSYGDIAATDPIGAPFLSWLTLELKRGNSHGTPWELLASNKRSSARVRPFEACILQARESAIQAGSFSWMLVLRRDHSKTLVFLPNMAWKAFRLQAPLFESSAVFRLAIPFERKRSGLLRVSVLCMPWEEFKRTADPGFFLEKAPWPPMHG